MNPLKIFAQTLLIKEKPNPKKMTPIYTIKINALNGYWCSL